MGHVCAFSRSSQGRRSAPARTRPCTLLSGKADGACLLLLVLRLLLAVPQLGFGSMEGSVVVQARRFLALAVSAEHLDLLFGGEFFLDGRVDEIDVQVGDVEQVVVGEIG
jgi:hypothetical protein